MKKIFSFVLITLICSSAIFSRNFLDGRIFEIQTNVPVNFSNNVFSMNEIMVNDLVIDLREIADSIPDEGLIFIGNTNPHFSINLDLRKFWIGLDFGGEALGKFTLSKDMFDFLGYGNEIGDELEVSGTYTFDTFAYITPKIGFSLPKAKITVKPSLFTPIVAINGSSFYLGVKNDENGRILLSMKSEAIIRSIYDPDESIGFSDFFMLNNYGVDIAGEIELTLNKRSNLLFAARIPLLPGKIYNAKYSFSTYEMDYGLLLNESNNTTETDSDSYVLNNDLYLIHRPLKFDVLFTNCPMGSLFKFQAGGGFGINHPFMSDFHFYPEYYLGLDVSLIHLITLQFSTEYTDQIFKHEFGLDVNLRFIELDAGFSLQSASFLKSFAATGFGAYVILTLGF